MLSAYDCSVGVTARGLRNLDALLRKGEAHALETGSDPAALLQARLAPDMFPLAGQVQRASDAAKLGIARLLGTRAPAFADDETRFAELYDRIARTLDYIEAASPDALEAGLQRSVEISTRGAKHTFVGQDYLLGFLLPNFFFHVAIAHGILRNQGVPVGKLDYLGKF